MIEKQKLTYQDGNVTLEGVYAFDNSTPGNKPAVLVFHDWSGCNEFAQNKAKMLAELGYIGFAVDMYGMGRVGTTTEEKQTLMKPLAEDRAALRQRALAALEAIKTLPNIDLQRIGAIGFCFGGLCALDLARSGADLRGVVSFHGLLSKPEKLADKKILAKILVTHGHDDPMVPPEQVLAFEREMTEQHVDWQVHVYGGTQHGFTNPLAKDPKMGIIYNEVAAKRSWTAMQNFFAEVLG